MFQGSGQEDDSMVGGRIYRTFRGRPRAIWRQWFVTYTSKPVISIAEEDQVVMPSPSFADDGTESEA